MQVNKFSRIINCLFFLSIIHQEYQLALSKFIVFYYYEMILLNASNSASFRNIKYYHSDEYEYEHLLKRNYYDDILDDVQIIIYYSNYCCITNAMIITFVRVMVVV